jgi:hypothetical protein
MGAHFGAQAGNRLAMELTHPGFGNAQYGGNLFEVHVLFVVHAHDVLFPLWKVFDSFNQGAA